MICMARTASGAECGGTVPCACGDVIRGQYRMSGDLGPCPGNGLTLVGNAVLDCRAHVIRGPGQPLDRGEFTTGVGIVLKRTDGAVVRNCGVTGFLKGIELREAHRSTVEQATVFDNGDQRKRVGYGIHLNRSVGNTVRHSTVRKSADEGIHVGTDSNDNTLVSNTFQDNGRENIYLLNVRGAKILLNGLSGRVSAAMYMKHTSLSQVEGNHFGDRPVVIRGNASGNVFVDNDFDGGIVMRSFTDGTAPTANLIRGGRVAGRQVCVAFSEAMGNKFEAVDTTECRRMTAHSTRLTANAFVDMPLERITLDLSGGATFRLQWRVRARIMSAEGSPVPKADITLRDRAGETVDELQSDASGRVEITVPTHVVNAAALVSLTPAELRVSADGFEPAQSVLAEPFPTELTLTLEPVR
jgi:parallel beta-helix repeat protein